MRDELTVVANLVHFTNEHHTVIWSARNLSHLHQHGEPPYPQVQQLAQPRSWVRACQLREPRRKQGQQLAQPRSGACVPAEGAAEEAGAAAGAAEVSGACVPAEGGPGGTICTGNHPLEAIQCATRSAFRRVVYQPSTTSLASRPRSSVSSRCHNEQRVLQVKKGNASKGGLGGRRTGPSQHGVHRCMGKCRKAVAEAPLMNLQKERRQG